MDYTYIGKKGCIILLKLHLKVKQTSLIPSNGLFTLSYQIKKG